MFYAFDQNNSGGIFSFDEDLGITHWVIIEADSEAEAISRAEHIGLYFNGCSSGMDCPCCGDRWSASYIKGSDQPEVDGRILTESTFKEHKFGAWMDEGKEACVHFKDGTNAWY